MDKDKTNKLKRNNSALEKAFKSLEEKPDFKIEDFNFDDEYPEELKQAFVNYLNENKEEFYNKANEQLKSYILNIGS